jgi:hypothetical protein
MRGEASTNNNIKVCIFLTDQTTQKLSFWRIDFWITLRETKKEGNYYVINLQDIMIESFWG